MVWLLGGGSQAGCFGPRGKSGGMVSGMRRITPKIRHLAQKLCLILLFSLIAPKAFAHELNPAVADLSVENNTLRAVIELNLETVIAGIGPEHEDTDDSPLAAIYNHLRGLDAAEIALEFDAIKARFAKQISLQSNGIAQPLTLSILEIPDIGDIETQRLSRISVVAPLPPGTTEMRFGWDAALGDIVVRTAADAGNYAAYLRNGQISDPIPVDGSASMGFWQSFRAYIPIGFDHIVPKGLDHILFVVGLFLLSASLRPLLTQITAFTLAHSITLGFGMAGWLLVPSAIVEPIIAASIVYVAVENILTPEMSRSRPFFVFGFGLLHGLGFAGVLAEFGMPQGQFLAGLIGFNIGVELGQLTVIAVCFLLIGFWFGGKAWYRRLIVIPASTAVAIIGLYWFIERVF